MTPLNCDGKGEQKAKMTTAVTHTGTVLPGQDLHCFVCDVAVSGRYYTLATCRTQSTKVRLIEKLGQLVGERYMVVISEDDIICRGCATLINTLDRLETEMGSVRGVVLRFLEKKYALEEGELVNSKPTGAPAPPPQITPSTNPSKEQKSDVTKKRKTISTDGESDGECNSGDGKKNTKSDTWMQCNKCKYTTDYNAFLVHHVKQHSKKKDPSPAGQEDSVDSTQTLKRFKSESVNSTDDIHENSSMKIKTLDPGDAETVEMIAAEINEYNEVAQNHTNSNSPMVIASVSQAENTDGTTSIVMTQGEDGQLTALTGTENHDTMTIDVSGMVMQGVDGVEGEAMCVMPITDETTGEHIEAAEDGNVYVHVVDMSGEEVGQLPAGSVGNVARVNDDGTVEMVQVMWDQMVTDNADGDQSQEFTLE
ncbi:uncharacterized protein LOC113206249 isoform X1 [Frankliniella occidentalis]|uniref:Uncharacterized protein LOC113206249 isoform X1 n=2 Tax=Frankliniella occidentalis TaxID=133901 RepID=A0A6J1SBJ0_FRAOC|nr:uncharacterized protein LOC113206249 isoform X1 [Frankliniella occidentalis]